MSTDATTAPVPAIEADTPTESTSSSADLHRTRTPRELVRSVRDGASGLGGSITLGVAALCLMLPFARLDFDRHHDGIMLGAAIAVKDGLHVQGDAFAQYGPVTSWLQALSMFLPVSPALAIRVLNVILIAVVVFLLADIGRIRPMYWPTRLWAGRLAAATWVAVADVFAWVPMLPWSSTVAAALSAGALYCIVRSLHDAEAERASTAKRWACAGGFLVGAMPFTRVNVGLATIAVVLTIGVVLSFFRVRESACARLVLAGLFSSLAFFVLVLFVTGSLGAWWQQSIVWPTKWQDGTSSTMNVDALKSTVRALRVPLLVVSVAAVAVKVLGRRRQRARSGFAVANVIFGISILAYFFLRGNQPGAIGAARVAGSSDWLPRTSSTINYLAFLSWSVILVAPLFALVTVCLTIAGRHDRRSAVAWIMLGGFGVAGLVQVWPVSDSRHYWWGLPLGLLFLFSIPDEGVGEHAAALHRFNPYVLGLLPSLLIAGGAGTAYLAVPRQAAPDDSATSGMLMSADPTNLAMAAEPLDGDFEAMHRSVPDGRSTLFYVNDGIFSSFDGHYHSIDPYFVYWGLVPPVRERLADRPFIVVDNEHILGIQAELNDFGYTLVERATTISIFAPPAVRVGP
jgi:hypothetical protein